MKPQTALRCVAGLMCLLLLAAGCAPPAPQTAGRLVRVGVYQNPPKIFTDANGNPSGFFVDLLGEIAARQGWQLAYTPCAWTVCLALLETGEIDLMPDVAYSPERDQKYDFHRIPAAESWSRVYAAPRSGIQRIDQLNGRRVALLGGSIQQGEFESLMQRFGFAVEIVPTASLEEAFRAAQSGAADAAIANHFFGDYFHRDYGLTRTSIVLSPAVLYYAVPQGQNADLLAAIDRYLGAWRDDSASIYYTILSRWEEKNVFYRLPPFVRWTLAGVAALLVLAGVWVLLLRRQVRVRTAHLEQANRLLCESEQRYQLISMLASDYVFWERVEEDGRVVQEWVAGALEAITGYTPQEFAERGGWRAVLHPDDLAQDDQDRQRLFANQAVSSEVRLVHRDGQTVWVQVYALPQWDEEHGRLAGIYGAVKDITTRKRAELELHRRVEELSALNSLSRQVSQSLSPQRVIAHAVNELHAACNADLTFLFLRQGERLMLHGVAPPHARQSFGEIPEHRVGECMCGLAAQEGRALYSRDIFSDMRCTWEECKQMGLRSFAALPLMTGSEVFGVVGLAAESERDFETQADFLETLASHAAAGIRNALLYDETQRHVRELQAVHQAGQRLARLHDLPQLTQEILAVLQETLGYDHGAVFLMEEDGKRFVPFVIGEDRLGGAAAEEARCRINSLGLRRGRGIAGWVAEHGESARVGDVRRDRRYLPLRGESDVRSILCVPLRYGETVIGTVSVESTRQDAYSESDQRLLETVAAQMGIAIQNARLLEEIRTHAARLEERVAERTRELEIARDRAQAADRTKSAFLATMSHELRTPLNSIIGFTGILLMGLVGELNDEQRKQLSMVQDSAQHLLELINDVLDISKIEAGQLELAHETFDLRAALQRSVEKMRPLAEKKGLALRCEIDPALGSLRGDRRRVEQIVLNLLSNAVKFTERGEVSLSARIENGWLVTRVRDTGIGIRPEDVEKIFQPFRQLETGITRSYEGTGLGLSICKRLVEAMGGTIQVESKAGRGSCFSFTLPLTQGA
ncbi:MAG: GAF domain-containing protein [Anaerolineae bacterium]|nr:GAF domain-containing protein [Anaerolineae bacterium]